jgi:hypothetical protein
MSSTRTKITYKCECGIDYGSCGRRLVLLMDYHNGSDSFILVHKQHADEEKPKAEYVIGGGDEEIEALSKILNWNDPDLEGWDDEDFEFMKQGRGW